MENGLVPILENHAKDAKDHPEMQQRIQQHADRTKQHAEMVKQCLERLGDSPSSMARWLESQLPTVVSEANAMKLQTENG